MHNIYYLGLSGERSLPFGLLVKTFSDLGILFDSGGSFGELRVYYSTEVLTATVDPGSVANVFDYYSQPQQGSRGIMGERVDVPAGSDPTAVKH